MVLLTFITSNTINNNTRSWNIVAGWSKYYFDFRTYKIGYFGWHIPVAIRILQNKKYPKHIHIQSKIDNV